MYVAKLHNTICTDVGLLQVCSLPNGADAARILAALIRDIPGGQVVDTAAIVAALPERTSGSDIREVVRRAVLAGDGGSISTATLLAEVGSGCYRARGLAGDVPLTYWRYTEGYHHLSGPSCRHFCRSASAARTAASLTR